MRHPIDLLKRAVVRWQLGNSPSARDRFSEDGDTLVEVLLAIVVLGIAAVALLTAFATAISASAEHRNLSSLDSSTRLAANVAIGDVQHQATLANPNPFVCPPTWSGPDFSNVTGFNVTSTVGYWNGTSFDSTCRSYAPQEYTLSIRSTGANSYSSVVTTVVYDPSAPPTPNGVGNPVNLVWLQAPASGTVGTAVTPQPEVAVEDALNNIVSNDLSSVTLKVVTGPGTFSSTCSGVESYGIVQFSNCGLSTAGTYQVVAVDSNSSVAATPQATVVISGASVAKVSFISAPVTATASKSANAGPITVQEQDPFGNPTFTPVTINLTSSSTTGIFSLTSGGPAVTSVTIPGGGVSSVSFYYGDTAAGSPTITATAPPLASNTQVETIQAGPAAAFSLSTPSATTGGSFAETITAVDAFGNVATSYAGTKCIVFSGPANSPKGNAPTYPSRGTCATGSSSVAFTNGVATPSITLFNAATTTLTATQGTITGSATFSVATGAFGTLSVANPGPQTAGTPFNVTLTGADAYGNPFTGTVSPTFSGPATSPNGTAPAYPSTVTFTNGTATAPVTLYDAQTTTLKVTSGGVSGTSTSFTVAAGPFSGFTMSTPTPTAGTAFNETITAGDAYGNGGAAFTGAKCIAFSGPTSSPNGNAPTYPTAGGSCTTGSAVTFSAGGVGTASITLFNAGNTTLTATSVATPTISGSTTFNVASASAHTFSIPTPLGSQTAGNAFTMAVGAADTYGNPFTGNLTTAGNGLSFSGPSNSPAPSNKAPAYPTSLTFTNGVANAGITLYDAQTTTLTVAATGVTPATTPITVTAGGASKFTLSTPAPTAGTPFNETITASDAFANVATGFTGPECIVFSGPANSPNGTAPTYPAAGACAAGQSSVTFTNGVANTIPITLTDAQSTSLTAKQGLITGTSANFTVSPGSAATLTATSGANQSATVNAAFTNKLVATATDALGNPVSGVAVTFAAPGSGASATFATCSSNPQSFSCNQNTGASGQATSSTFTANGTNGAYVITASAPGLTSATFAEANKANQTITFTSTAPGAATVGGATYTPTATATSGLVVSITVDGTSSGVCSITGGIVSFTGPGTCTLDANQAGNTTFNAAPQVQQTFTVKRTQTVSFTSTAPGAATVGGATYRPSATATSGLAVTITVDGTSSSVCSITGGAVSYQGAGSCVLDANQAGNGTFYAATQVQQTFTVGKGSQTISFTSTAPGTATVGGATYTPTATATSGLAVTITVDGTSSSVCSITGGTVTFTGPGTCTLDANQAGNGDWNPATQVQQTFTVKRAQTISFTSTAPGAASVGGATYTPAATATSGLAVTITADASSAGVCSITGGVVSYQSAGSCVLDANQAGNGTFYAAPQVQQTYTVSKGNQTITFTSTAPGAATVGGATYTAAATSTSGLIVTFSSGSTSVCTSGGTNGSVFTFVGSGTCTVNANQAGNGNWNAATQAQQNFTVSKNNQTVSFTSTAPGAATVGGATYTPSATATSGLAVTITVDNTSSSVCSITGGAVSYQGAGSCVLDANQAGNGTFNAATQVQQTYTVGKGSQTITYTSTAPGAASVGGATYTASATATSGLAVTFSSGTTSVCTSGGTNGSVFTFVGPGTCTVNANQAGNGSWNAAPQAPQTFTVKRAQTISFTSTAPGAASVGGATYTPAATATSGLAVTITADASSAGVCSITGGVVSYQSAGSCVLDANQAGNGTFYAAPQVQQTYTVSKGNQTITFTSTAPGAATVGGATYTAAATSTSGLIVTFSSGSTSVCTSGGTNGSVFTFVGSGTCTVNANQAGNGNWNAATQAQQNFTVSKNNQTVSFTSTAPGAATVGGATYTPSATATSGLAVTITVDNTSSSVCSITGGAVSYQGAGSCVLDANQAGNGTFNAATQVQQTYTVGKGSQTITYTSTAPGAASVGGATYTASATATSGLAVTFSSGTTSVCTSGGTNGSVFTFVGPGTCTVNANQAGNGSWNAAPQAPQTFTVKRAQTISFTSTAPGAASVGGATYTPAATATSGLAVTITADASSAGVCSITGGVVSYQSAGSCVLDANQAGNGTFYAAPQVQQSFAVTGLTITSDQLSSATAASPLMTLSGTGATGTGRVTVVICAVNSFPCSNRNTQSSPQTGTSPANPWTTAATGSGDLDYATTYFAQATQGAQTSPVFTFATPTQNAPTAVTLTNGGTSRVIDTNDTAAVTFSGDVNASTICSTWTNTGNQSLANATITFTSSGNNDTLTATSGSCTGNGHFGTVTTGANYVGGTVTFTNSTITWNPTTDVLTFKLGTLASGSGNRNTGVTAGRPGYTANAALTDTSGIPIDTTPFTSTSTSGF